MVRLIATHEFGIRDGLRVLIEAPVSFVLLLVCDYVHFRTRITVSLFLFLFFMLIVCSAHFSVAMGIVVLGIWVYNTVH